MAERTTSFAKTLDDELLNSLVDRYLGEEFAASRDDREPYHTPAPEQDNTPPEKLGLDGNEGRAEASFNAAAPDIAQDRSQAAPDEQQQTGSQMVKEDQPKLEPTPPPSPEKTANDREAFAQKWWDEQERANALSPQENEQQREQPEQSRDDLSR